LGGIAAMVCAFILLFRILFTNIFDVVSTTCRPILKKFYWLLVTAFLLFDWIGRKPVKDVFDLVGILFFILEFLNSIRSNTFKLAQWSIEIGLVLNPFIQKKSIITTV
jgi:quinol-cytochrome oxidoreductase complex cytochrome b subunit